MMTAVGTRSDPLHARSLAPSPDRSTRAASYVLLVGVAVLMLAPFAWSVSTSLKTSPEAAQFPQRLLPREPTLQAYRTVVLEAPFARWFANSIVVALAVVVTRCSLDTLSGYAFARLRFPGRETLFALILSTLMVSPMVLLIPRFILLQQLGLVNTLPALWLPFASEAFGVFLMRQVFESFPDNLEDAARIDGAGRLRIFWQLAVPNALPALAALAIFSFQGSWNRFLEAVIFISGANRDQFTLPLGLAYFRSLYYTDWPVVMAIAVLTMLPIAAVYLAGQRYFVESVARSGLRG
ncbi:MAG: carbohydrate ABC transporter permease [Chloroflexi bacterium]|nr:carbohydrate ABC transporter permease [Chloroflexota bacterium]